MSDAAKIAYKALKRRPPLWWPIFRWYGVLNAKFTLFKGDFDEVYQEVDAHCIPF